MDFSLPAVSVQPIVENAVKYGVGEKEDGGTVKTATRETEASDVIAISGDGIGFDTGAENQDDRSHIGIGLVTQRLKAQCGGTPVIDGKIENWKGNNGDH